jgi:hypothetical protein
VHADVEVHDTPVSALKVAPGFTVDCMAKLVPFQISATVNVPVLFVNDPEATHEVPAVQETPDSWLEVAPVGFGVAITSQP